MTLTELVSVYDSIVPTQGNFRGQNLGQLGLIANHQQEIVESCKFCLLNIFKIFCLKNY